MPARTAITSRCRVPAGLACDLFQKSGAAGYGITLEIFAAVLEQAAAKYVRDEAGEAAVREFCTGLRVEELVLARACAAGNERAWEVFLTRYRATLYDAARGIVREDVAAKELADSIYADLYGMRAADGGQHVSKLSSYMGRGSLAGWLRTVLAQEYINRYRVQRRLVSLEEQTEAGIQFAAKPAAATPSTDPRLEAAVDGALSGLPAEEKFTLAAYYLDGRTLAEIARALRVHESTVSRKLEKTAKSLRKAIIAELLERGMSRQAAEEALETDVRDLQVKVRERLASGVENRATLPEIVQKPAPQAFHAREGQE